MKRCVRSTMDVLCEAGRRPKWRRGARVPKPAPLSLDYIPRAFFTLRLARFIIDGFLAFLVLVFFFAFFAAFRFLAMGALMFETVERNSPIGLSDSQVVGLA